MEKLSKKKTSKVVQEPMAQTDPDFIRADSRCRCDICGLEYQKHPEDAEFPFLVRLCDGSLVKL